MNALYAPLRRWLLGGVIAACFDALDLDPTPVSFLRDAHSDRLARALDRGPVLLLERRRVRLAYRDASPGRPVRWETHDCLAGLMVSLLEPVVRRLATHEARQSLGLYGLSHTQGATHGRHLSAMAQLRERLACDLLRRVDRVLTDATSRLTARLVFGPARTTPGMLRTALDGRWQAGGEVRQYGADALQVLREHEPRLPPAHYRWQVVHMIDRMMTVHLQAADDAAPREERVVLSADGACLTLYGDYGPRRYTRAA